VRVEHIDTETRGTPASGAGVTVVQRVPTGRHLGETDVRRRDDLLELRGQDEGLKVHLHRVGGTACNGVGQTRDGRRLGGEIGDGDVCLVRLLDSSRTLVATFCASRSAAMAAERAASASATSDAAAASSSSAIPRRPPRARARGGVRGRP
jgi:hypothetical protein